MFVRSRLRALLPLAAIAITVLLGGCVYSPYGYYGYGYPYGYNYAYATPPSVSFDFGYWGHPGWHNGYH
jgi:hypothetical protein